MSFFYEKDNGDMYDYLPGQYVYGDDMYIPEEYMEEKWWNIDGIPDYMVSDHGRVWSIKNQKFLKPKKGDRKGHESVCLYVHGQPHYYYIHRLMGMAFIPNPKNHPYVRHLNDVPNENEVSNLAWGTQADNYRDSVRNGNAKSFTDEMRELSAEKTRKPIVATRLATGKQIHFRGQQEAARELGLQQANIWKVLNGQREHTCGWSFEYVK
jgi:hypothetical protein